MVEYWIWKWKPPNLNILKVAPGTSSRDTEMIFLTEPSRKCSTEEIGELCERARNLYRIIPRPTSHLSWEEAVRLCQVMPLNRFLVSDWSEAGSGGDADAQPHCNQSPSLAATLQQTHNDPDIVVRRGSVPPPHICKHLKYTWHLRRWFNELCRGHLRPRISSMILTILCPCVRIYQHDTSVTSASCTDWITDWLIHI